MPGLSSTSSVKAARVLAILGGTPTFSQPLHVGGPNIGDRERFLARVTEILDRRWLTNDGPLVREFEQGIATLVGVRHCVAMCNATVALEIAIRALNLSGEVIVPSYTFVATAHALQWQEITPVFADMDPSTCNIDPETISRLVTPRTTGIIGVHVWGRPCNTVALQKIADRHGLKLLYDAAHAFGCSHQGQMIGTFGECEIFSFHATKFVNSFEGGAVVTNDDTLAATMRLMRNFGFSGYDCVNYLGMNGKMTEVCAAMGLASLQAMPQIVAQNRRNYEAYRQGIRGLRGISLIEYSPQETNNYQYIVVDVDAESAGLDRDELVAMLHRENVLARKYFWPGCHRMQPYRSLQPNAGLLLPHTERVAARLLVLPTGESVNLETIATICNLIRAALSDAGTVRAHLRRIGDNEGLGAAVSTL